MFSIAVTSLGRVHLGNYILEVLKSFCFPKVVPLECDSDSPKFNGVQISSGSQCQLTILVSGTINTACVFVFRGGLWNFGVDDNQR